MTRCWEQNLKPKSLMRKVQLGYYMFSSDFSSEMYALKKHVLFIQWQS